MARADPGPLVERLGGALASAGMPRAASLVLSALMVDDDGRMTAAELGEALALSAGSVSAAVRYLGQIGVVRRERDRGSRRDVFVVDDDTWHRAMVRTDQLYAPIIAALQAGMAELGQDSPAHLRLLLTKEFLEFVNREMTALMVRWDAHRQAMTDDD
ncbi:GbsR/MarR family transcriptional regulator [Angustibacter sp. McL0619]|uniref:GbsR/MarR family transcriptional regulator n=1 Tax=Angustibacter sp. McL0619 TaxID=3415676 RepID=UPI003CEFB0E9